MIFESATGLIFLGLIITYMPLLDQAYASREVGNLLIRSRAGTTPSAIRLLHRYAGTDHSEILRGKGSPTVNTLIKLAEALDVEVCDFFIFAEQNDRARAVELIRNASPETIRRILREIMRE